jgi:vacuolar-type H+-ATPase subunit E/Vma4
MGRGALIESLRGKAAEEVDALWRDARSRADGHRQELARALDRQRAEDARAAAAAAQRLEDDARIEAEHRAREIRGKAVLALAGRLHELALAELPRLRGEGGAALFSGLARELPVREWQRVRVNPADRDLAREQFPSATVEDDPSVCGGMIVEAEGGRISVSNSLETRLARAWPDVLPGLIEGLLPETRDHGPAA